MWLCVANKTRQTATDIDEALEDWRISELVYLTDIDACTRKCTVVFGSLR